MSYGEIQRCYWFETVAAPSFSDTDFPAKVEVLVVGAGISGLSTAYHLLLAGRAVTVIDKGRLAMGASGRNTGMMTSEIKKEYASVIADDGIDEARALLGLVHAAVDGIDRTIKREGIACGFARVESLYLAEGPKTERELVSEYEATSSLGIACEVLDAAKSASEYPAIRATRILRKKGEASMNPYAFCVGLAEAVVRMGGRIIEGVSYIGSDEDALGVKVMTDKGIVLAEHLCLCSDADIDAFLPVPTPVIPTWESVIVTRPLPPSVVLPSRGELIWNAFPLFEYARILEGNRIMIGSERTIRVRGERPPPDPAADLLRGLGDVFDVPDAEIEFLWTGMVSVTDDWKPYADRISPRTLVCGGYNGHGLTLGFMAGEVLAARITERAHPHAATYAYPHKTGRLGKFLYRFSPAFLRSFAVRIRLGLYRHEDTQERKKP